ncbi:MAG: hypothetical protein OXD39_02475, partial [Gemmatimonadetes bacterium]|nr:hypothetical protein [Gemmatimonadota bacterium]
MEIQLQPQTRQQFSPQLMYSLKLLQYTTVELEQEIKAKIEENPLLELEDETREAEEDSAGESLAEEPDATREDDPGEMTSDRDKIDWDAHIQDGMHNQMDSREEFEKREDQNILEREGKSGATLTQYLVEQLRLLDLSKRDLEIGEYLIGNL